MRKLILVIGAILASYLIYLWESPRSFVVDFGLAVKEKDVDRICGYIDFPALQRNLVRRGYASVAEELQADGYEESETKGRVEGMLDTAARELINCDSLREHFSEDGPGVSVGSPLLYTVNDGVEIERNGLMAFTLRNEGKFWHFRNDVSGWKLDDYGDAP